jgi:hypothetical protein
MARQEIPWIDATTDLPWPDREYEDLLVLDVHAGARCIDVIRPDLWVVPMDNRTAYENAVELAPTRHGPELWVWNNIHVDDGELTNSAPLHRRTVPEHLAARVEFAPHIIHRDAAIADAADDFRMPRGEGPTRALHELVRDMLIRVGVLSELADLAEPSAYGRPWRGTRRLRETPAEISAYLHMHARSELEARERLQAFFAA